MNNSFFDHKFIMSQIKEDDGRPTVFHQMQESMEESNQEAKKQNQFSNRIQIWTLICSILTLLATIWFGIYK